MTHIETMKLALEALEENHHLIEEHERPDYLALYDRRIHTLRQAIAEAEKQEQCEPVAFEEWLSKQHGDPEEIGFLQALRIAYISGQDSITTPQQRKPLTDEEIEREWQFLHDEEGNPPDHHDFARAIEAKLKEKTT